MEHINEIHINSALYVYLHIDDSDSLLFRVKSFQKDTTLPKQPFNSFNLLSEQLCFLIFIEMIALESINRGQIKL